MKRQVDLISLINYGGGWVYGEGCFLINHKPLKNSVSYRFRFEIGMHKNDLPLLEFIHRTLGIGGIYIFGTILILLLKNWPKSK